MKKKLEIKRKTLNPITPEETYKLARPILFEVWELGNVKEFDEALEEIHSYIGEHQEQLLTRNLNDLVLNTEDCREALYEDWIRWSDA